MTANSEGRRVTQGMTAILAMAGALWGVVAGAQPVRVRVRVDSTQRDSTAEFRIRVSPAAIDRMIRELMASKQMEETIGLALRTATTGERGDAKRLKELAESLGRIARRNAALITQIEIDCPRGRPQRDGYLGVAFSELLDATGGEGAGALTLRDWPEILSVEPGSPAS